MLVSYRLLSQTGKNVFLSVFPSDFSKVQFSVLSTFSPADLLLSTAAFSVRSFAPSGFRPRFAFCLRRLNFALAAFVRLSPPSTAVPFSLPDFRLSGPQ